MGECDDALNELYAFLDEELTPENRARIHEHLEACHDCLEVYDFEAELRNVIAQKCRDQVPPDVLDRLRESLRREISDRPDVSPA
jgi:mycothiol system anti-sigma-R factor